VGGWDGSPELRRFDRRVEARIEEVFLSSAAARDGAVARTCHSS